MARLGPRRVPRYTRGMARAFTSRRIAGIGAGAFMGVLTVAFLLGAGAFVWTIENTEAPQDDDRSSFRRSPDPDPAFPQKIRQMYALGGDRAVLAACNTRRNTWPNDAEAWIYSAFALERIAAKEPGLGAIAAQERARRIWVDLHDKATDLNRGMIGSRPYMEAWALMGLGRTMLATEAFGRYADQYTQGTRVADSYNRACYLAMAGDFDAAQHAFSLAAQYQNLQLGWAAADPDLETLHGTFEFRVWNTYYELRRSPERRDYARHREQSPGGPRRLETN